MSQASWTRKPHSDLSAGTSDNTLSEQATHVSNSYNSTSGVTIPANKGSKHYTMEEVFKVWYDNKDHILNSISSFPPQQNENYKATEPGQIYHLDLQSLNKPSPSESVSSESTLPKDNGVADASTGLNSSATAANSNSNSNANSNDSNANSNANSHAQLKSPSTTDGLNDSLAKLTTADSHAAKSEPSRSAHGPPPGMLPKSGGSPSASPNVLDIPLLHPTQIEWFYLDPSGNEQGPFNGNMMQEWLTDGYLNLELRIRRKEQPHFQTLKELCDRLENYIQPFQVPLPDLNYVRPEEISATGGVFLPQQQQRQHVQQLPPQFDDPSQLNPSYSANHQQPQQQHPGLIQQQQQQQQQQQFSFGQQPSQLHQFLSHGTGAGALGAANMRLNPSMGSQSNLFTNDFMTSQDPFVASSTTPLTPSVNPAAFPNQFGIDTVNAGGIGGFGQPLGNGLHMPSLLQQQIQNQHQPVLSRTNSGWAIDTSAGFMGSTPTTPVAGVAQPLTSQLSQPVPMSPWISGAQSASRVSSPFVSSTNLAGNTGATGTMGGNVDNDPLSAPSNVSNTSNNNSNNNEQNNNQTHHVDDHVLSHIHNSVVTDILGDGDDDKFSASGANKPQQSSKQDQRQSTKPTQPDSGSEFQGQTQLDSAPQVNQEEETFHKDQELQNDTDNQAGKIGAKVPSIENLKPASQPQQQLAPWAAAATTTKTTTTSKPKMTLKEIQRLEAEKVAKQKQETKLEQAAIAAAAAKAWAEEEKQQQLASEKPGLPKTSSWATSAKPVVAKKTLAEIQKEEAELAAAAKAKAAATAQANASSLASISNVGTGSVSASRPSFANAVANAVPKDDNAWTTVTSKKPAASSAAASVKRPVVASTISSANKTSPQLLRSVSANKPIVNSIDASAVREDFLVWARSSMTNLYPTVSKDDLLDIFVTLPLHGGESSQLIAETIYSSSATMDGRRFAQEFLKRRQKVEQSIGHSDDVSWSSAIIASADKVQTVDEDGWSTSVKTKKKNRKN